MNLRNLVWALVVSAGIILAGLMLGNGVESPTMAQSTADERLAGSSAQLASEEVLIPEGEFIRGCTDDTVGPAKCYIESKPLQAVYLDAYYIDRTEVSNAQYATCVAAGACLPPMSYSSTTRYAYYDNPTYANYPVIHVDWDRANTYCQWLGKRLPTEAEWEKAARGTDHRLFPWGDSLISCEKCNCNIWYYDYKGDRREAPCVGDTSPVGGYEDYASPYGVLDMVGNVREWVNDIYLKPYYLNAPYYNPQGPVSTDANEHLARGGSWKGTYTHSNTWVRFDEADIYETHLLGFRCARTAAGLAPTPTPTASPTPVPHPEVPVGSAGGAVWLSTDDQLTVLVVPDSATVVTRTVGLLYERLPDLQGDLQGTDHFFSLTDRNAAGEVSFGSPFAEPVRLMLSYRELGGIIPNTVALYRATATGWITDHITQVARYPGYLEVQVLQPGTYGLLGETHRTFLPVTWRR